MGARIPTQRRIVLECHRYLRLMIPYYFGPHLVEIYLDEIADFEVTGRWLWTKLQVHTAKRRIGLALSSSLSAFGAAKLAHAWESEIDALRHAISGTLEENL